MIELVYVLPVHNEEAILAANVERLTKYLARFPGAEVFLVENGSKDASWTIAQSLAGVRDGVTVCAFREENAGIGYAYHRGLSEALARWGPSKTRWAVLTAADLPFGLSDLEAALVTLGSEAKTRAETRAGPRVLMGSKAHPRSQVDRGASRAAMTAAYRALRRVTLGMRVGDSQGSVFLRLDLAAELVPRIRARGFFYSTELCHFAERAGERILELPVVLEPRQRESTVRPVHDGVTMARQLWELRRRRDP